MGSGMSTLPPNFVFKGALATLLVLQLARGRRPLATAALLAANALAFYRPGAIGRILPEPELVGFNPQLLLNERYRDYLQQLGFLGLGELLVEAFLLPPFYHVDEGHLLSNMAFLLSMGARLEASMGTAEFASMTTALLGLSRGIAVLLSKGLMILLGHDVAACYEYSSVGFSGVIFGMEAVLAWSYGHPVVLIGRWTFVPAKYAVWAHLFVLRALPRKTNFLGHLSGLLAGIVYHYCWRLMKRCSSINRNATTTIRSMALLPTRFAQKLLSSVTTTAAAAGDDDRHRRDEGYPHPRVV
ncbi:hypothetical protein U9M48_016819 [Paspalum notatum var. saurae]|uniref:Peptidase S54 rhomboid domain-containing protein n=1 Tax=Paspalum notatum var. saurae TaxID=547442 RepID=A0AAQ3WMZ3_PASNO